MRQLREEWNFREIYALKWRRKWKPTPVFLPGESHGQSSLVGYNPRCRKESDMTEHTAHALKIFKKGLLWGIILLLHNLKFFKEIIIFQFSWRHCVTYYFWACLFSSMSLHVGFVLKVKAEIGKPDRVVLIC